MSEIAALEPNGFRAVSTFSGCGGSSTGYRMAGFRMLWASEFVEAARETYRANAAAYTILDGRDVREVQPADILAATGLREGEIDLFDGSPPCAAFSTVGKREKGWGTAKKYSDTVQRSDDLFHEYARLVRGCQPRTFVAENVSGLVKGTAKGYFLEILRALKACGYRVEARVLDAQWLGVPQTRARLIFVGVREDLRDADGGPLMPAFPDPLPYRHSIRDALPWITRAVHDTSGTFSKGDFTNDPSPAITVTVNSLNSRHYQVEGPEPMLVVGDPSYAQKPGNTFPRGARFSADGPCPAVMASPGIVGSAPHFLENAPVEPESDITRFAIGEEWNKLRPGEQSERFFQLVRPDPDGPSPCVTASGGNSSTAGVTHPHERRKFSIAELRRICGFPDDFVLTGTYAQQWERLGRAVPPVMMSHVAAAVRDRVLRRAA
jgi:DNA (cytosine-5)-methyltransferase 1